MTIPGPLLTQRLSVIGLCLSILTGCSNQTSAPTAPSASSASIVISNDAALFRQFTQTDPFTSYTVFPNAEEFTTGRLVGSEAHRPVIRVRLNGTATAALRNGTLPSGTVFPNGSIVLKEIRPAAGAAPSLFAVMVKDSGNPLAGDGWLWIARRARRT